MDFRRALTATGSKVHLSKDTKWHYEPIGQWKRGRWVGMTLCDQPVLYPPDLPSNEEGEVVYEQDRELRDRRPVDCARCLSYARREIEHLEKVLSGEW